MKLSWFISTLAFGYCSLSFGNILTNDTDYDISLDVHRSQIASTSATLIGASWVLEKPIGLFYGMSARFLASPVDGFSTLARKKSLSLYYAGPVVGWDIIFHRVIGLQAHLLYGMGSAKYNETTGTYDSNKNEIIKTQSSDLSFIEPEINLRLGSYLDMQAILGGGIRILMTNAHSDRVPDSALGKSFIQLGIIKRMSKI